MLDGSVYYCWSCDAHCRGVNESTEGACCPRCQEQLPADSKLKSESLGRGLFAISENPEPEPVRKRQTGLWIIRTAAMH